MLAWSTLVEPRAFVLREFEVPVLPSGARPVRVLHLSDLHLVPGQRTKQDWVRSLAELEPELVVTTGDNLAHQDAVPAVLDTYRDLLDIPGVFVLGSNDYYPPTPKNPLRYFNDSHEKGEALTTRRLPTQDLVDGFTRTGWLDLTNARGRLELGELSVEFVGVDDPHLEYDDYGTVAGPAAPGTDLFVGVTHAPYQRVLDAMVTDGAALILAGHTHGGQVCIPFYGALVTNCDLDTRRVKGLSRWWPGAGSTPSDAAPPDASWLEVSAGLGASPYSPFRFACRPEATLLTLV
ncbi:metallophosphoesterase [Ornithinimicrobium ciconiae]|uniref:metallophosphoesterase n=1 Tax=Ornithinimicrobium ciconiae TaxID=2594265 RepID=UPI001D1835BE|nr:metallophosphoesterase [Ornithinimicrobium ciconiae]